jgi:hypothetical protein
MKPIERGDRLDAVGRLGDHLQIVFWLMMFATPVRIARDRRRAAPWLSALARR